MAKDPLVGKFCHIMFGEGHKYEGTWEYQLRVVDRVGDFYLVQFYSALTGFPTNQKLVKLDYFVNAKFYDDSDSWREEGERMSERLRMIIGDEVRDEYQPITH